MTILVWIVVLQFVFGPPNQANGGMVTAFSFRLTTGIRSITTTRRRISFSISRASLSTREPSSSLSSAQKQDPPVDNLEHVPRLKNDYFALRHGQSLANVAGVIASNPEVACAQYGLSEEGQRQARLAGQDVVQIYEQQPFQGLLILSSDLLRAKETAQAVEEAALQADIPLHNNTVILKEWLRERGFGAWDGGSDDNYQKVWEVDAVDATHEERGVESVAAVMRRCAGGILDCDDLFENYMVVCVAHGDVLQILQTAFEKMDGRLHRSLPHLETATLRKLELK